MLAISVYVVKIYLGVKHQGVRGYLKGMVYPPGACPAGPTASRPADPRRDLHQLAVHAFRPAVREHVRRPLLLAFFSSVGFWFLFERLTVLGAGSASSAWHDDT